MDVPEVTARNTCWSKMQSLFPAHFHAATIALCSPASTLACESTFSVAAYIMNKLRSRMTAQTHELLTLAKINVERSLKENDKLMALEMEAKTRRCLNNGGAGHDHRRHRRLGHRPSPRRPHRPSTDERAASASPIDHRLHV